MRETVDPVRDDRGDETHPAFGVVTVARSSGSPRALFQSDLLHNETIRLAIHTATRQRDLSHDWVHSERQIVEVEMSLAQWGALVSSVGMGAGTPVTIQYTREDGMVPGLPHQPRLQEGLHEVGNATDKLLAQVKAATNELHDAIHNKKGIRAEKVALSYLESTLANARSNSEFVMKSLNEAGEHVVSQAKADIEAFLLQAQQRQAGLSSSINAPIELSQGEE